MKTKYQSVGDAVEQYAKNPRVFIMISPTCLLEKSGEYRGHTWAVLFVDNHRCGYVRVDEHSVLDQFAHYGHSGFPELDVHGGVTFFGTFKGNERKWVGFDAHHLGDKPDDEACGKYGIPVCERMDWGDVGASVKCLGYMENECKSIIDQLHDLE